MKNSFLLLLFLVSACIRPEEPPATVIPKDTMAQILIDIHLAEAKVSIKPMGPDSANAIYKKYKERIFDKYKISPQRFDESMNFYSRNLEEMNKVYEVVVDSLSLREGRGKID